jgi:Rieske Fe-S protein
MASNNALAITMLSRRQLLTYATAVTAAIGAIGIAVPFIGSLAPSERARANHEMQIDISAIPPDTFHEHQWYWRRVFVGRTPELTVLSIPYFDEAYRLPDPTWARPVIPCKRFGYADGQFQCFDDTYIHSWVGTYKWDKKGRSLKKDIPDIQSVEYALEGEYIVLGRAK